MDRNHEFIESLMENAKERIDTDNVVIGLMKLGRAALLASIAHLR